MPPGSMTVLRQMGSLPGHEGYGTIQITYSFHPGTHVSYLILLHHDDVIVNTTNCRWGKDTLQMGFQEPVIYQIHHGAKRYTL